MVSTVVDVSVCGPNRCSKCLTVALTFGNFLFRTGTWRRREKVWNDGLWEEGDRIRLWKARSPSIGQLTSDYIQNNCREAEKRQLDVSERVEEWKNVMSRTLCIRSERSLPQLPRTRSLERTWIMFSDVTLFSIHATCTVSIFCYQTCRHESWQYVLMPAWASVWCFQGVILRTSRDSETLPFCSNGIHTSILSLLWLDIAHQWSGSTCYFSPKAHDRYRPEHSSIHPEIFHLKRF